MENSKIEWTHHTFNPWIGCSHKHTGCANCYAEADQADRRGRVIWGQHGTRSRTSGDNWSKVKRWDREAADAGERRRVFCASNADIFEDWDGPILDHNNQVLVRMPSIQRYVYLPQVSEHEPLLTMNDCRRDAFRLLASCANLDKLLLTKRPENVLRMWPEDSDRGFRVESEGRWWVGMSVSNQPTFDAMIQQFLPCRRVADVLYLSIEPLLGPINLDAFLYEEFLDMPPRWVIVGGESGTNARPCELDWIRSIVRQCRRAKVPCFVKQLGYRASDEVNGIAGRGLKVAHEAQQLVSLRLIDKKGGDDAEWPEDLRVRQFPEVCHA
jgi:protein gp37